MQDEVFADLADGQEMIWSESSMSEDGGAVVLLYIRSKIYLKKSNI